MVNFAHIFRMKRAVICLVLKPSRKQAHYLHNFEESYTGRINQIQFFQVKLFNTINWPSQLPEYNLHLKTLHSATVRQNALTVQRMETYRLSRAVLQ